MIKTCYPTWIKILVLASALLCQSDLAIGQMASHPMPEKPQEDASFHPGMSCDLIAEWSESQLVAVIQNAEEADLKNFCQPEQYYHCSDYSSLLFGRASLEAGPEGYLCALTR